MASIVFCATKRSMETWKKEVERVSAQQPFMLTKAADVSLAFEALKADRDVIADAHAGAHGWRAPEGTVVVLDEDLLVEGREALAAQCKSRAPGPWLKPHQKRSLDAMKALGDGPFTLANLLGSGRGRAASALAVMHAYPTNKNAIEDLLDLDAAMGGQRRYINRGYRSGHNSKVPLIHDLNAPKPETGNEQQYINRIHRSGHTPPTPVVMDIASHTLASTLGAMEKKRGERLSLSPNSLIVSQHDLDEGLSLANARDTSGRFIIARDRCDALVLKEAENATVILDHPGEISSAQAALLRGETVVAEAAMIPLGAGRRLNGHIEMSKKAAKDPGASRVAIRISREALRSSDPKPEAASPDCT